MACLRFPASGYRRRCRRDRSLPPRRPPLQRCQEPGIDEKALESVAATGSRITLEAVCEWALSRVCRQHGGSETSEKPQVVGVTGGALGLSAIALAFGFCCVAPWAVAILGVSGAVLLARLAFIQPYVVAGTIVLLGLGFLLVYRRPGPAGTCDVMLRRRLRWIVWSAAIVVVLIDVASFAPRFWYG
jgi:mercuric ion transport protein